MNNNGKKGFLASLSNSFTIFWDTWSGNNAFELKDEKEMERYVIVDGYEITLPLTLKII